MRAVITIIKKDLNRFFKDKRMLCALFLPGIMIYLIYSLIGSGLNSITKSDKEYVYKINVVGAPSFITEIIEQEKNIEFNKIEIDKIEEVKKSVENKETDLLIIFPENFEKDYNSIINGEVGAVPPQVQCYFNTTRVESTEAFSLFSQLIGEKQQIIIPFFISIPFDLATEKDTSGMIMSSLGPMLILMFLFSGAMAIVPESIAGEKERGTFATMLVTPAKRSDIALGKIMSMSILSLMSGVCSFLGILFALPKLMNGTGVEVNAMVYGLSDAFILFLVIVSTVLLMVTLTSIVSTYAKSVKEANSMIGPMSVIIMLVGLLCTFTPGGTKNLFLYLIPFYNSAQAISSVLSFNFSAINFIVAFSANVLYTVILVVVLAKMFNSEKIIFNN